MKKEHFDFLKTKRACQPGLEWAKTQSDLYELWNNCHRGDWLLWLADKLQVDSKKLMLCGALCAHTVIQYMKDPRSREAVRIAFLYARGKATDAQLKEAKIDTEDAVGAAYDDGAAVARAAHAAVYAADTWYVVYTAVYAADATINAAWNDPDVDEDAAIAARKANKLRTAEIARKILTQDVFNKLSNL